MIEILRKTEEAVSRILLMACVLLVIVASLGRWVGYPIIWSVDMAQLLFVWICFLGANQAMRNYQHVALDLILVHLKPRVQRWVMLVHYVLIEAFLLALVYYGINLTLLNVERQFGDTPITYAWVTVSVPVGAALLFCTILVGVFRLITADGPAAAKDPRS